MRLYRHPFFFIWVALLVQLVCHDSAQAEITSVRLGVNGQCKLGYWVPAKITFDGKLPDDLVVAIGLPDTDGVQARFVDDSPIVTFDGKSSIVETVVKLGRTKGMVEVQLFEGINPDSHESTDDILDAKRYRVESLCTPQDPLLEFYVSVGRSVEIKGASTLGGINDYAPAISAALENVNDLGKSWKSFESIDGMVLEAGSMAENPIPEKIQDALHKWVRQGGRLAITGGPKLKLFFENNKILASLFDGEIIGSRRMNTTTAMERMVKASSPVSGQRNRPLVAIPKNFSGEVIIQDGADPVIIRQRAGFGHFLLVTVNLAENPIAEWGDRKSFCGYIVSLLNFQSDNRRGQEKRGTRFGYQDISGQLRTALDSFSGVAIVNFTVVAAIAILFICLIGPADYFFLKKFVKKMEWTWLTFLLIVVSIIVLTFWIHSSAKSNRLLCRQVEVVDVDVENQSVRGSLWAHVYSPASRKYDIDWKVQKGLKRESQFGGWLGFPGDALGGMNNHSAMANTKSKYNVHVESSKISDLPINIAATKGLQMEWTGMAQVDSAGSLSVRRSQLVGRVSNPLNIELTNVFVVYDGDVYQFKSKLKSGDSFDIDEDTSERSLADYLNQRKVKDLGTEATAWSVTDTNLRRILEIMMFYEHAGGRGYVNLFQRFQANIDFSHIDQTKNAILVGRSRNPANRMVINGDELNDEYEESWTYYRILIPVSKGTGN